MNYKQAMRWQKKHPKGTRQPVIFSTMSGFWPSVSWSEQCWNPYVDACQALGIEPMECEAFYNATLRGKMMSTMTAENQAEYTRLRRIRAQEDDAANKSQT